MKIQEKKKVHIRWMLVCYDILIYLLSAILLLGLYGGNDKLSYTGIFQQMCISMVCIFGIRLLGNIYGQVWRYGGILIQKGTVQICNIKFFHRWNPYHFYFKS